MIRTSSIFATLAVALALSASAQDNPLFWRGAVETDHRLLLKDDQEWAWNETRLDLTLEKRMHPLRVVGNAWFRHLGPSVVHSTSDLYHKDRISPYHVDMRELYAEVHGFISEKLDVKIGRQEFAWGTADRFNPTNNLNPHDLEDILDFGRVLGSDALSLQWHFSFQSSLQLAYVTRFQPASMPLGVFSGLFAFPVELPLTVQPEYRDSLIMPQNNFSEGATLGMRFRSFAAGTDWSLSYVYGRDPLPLPVAISMGFDQSTGNPYLDATLVYARHHIIGADLAGSIGRVGIWAEMAVFIPESSLELSFNIPPHQLPVEIPEDEIILEKEGYAKYVIGCDYSFAGGSYLNIQYLRGFIHERGRDQLTDYMVIQMQRNFFYDRLAVTPLAGIINITDRKDIPGHYDWIYAPEVTYRGIDNLSVTLGGFFFGGQGNSIFSGMKNKHMLRLHVSARF